MRFGWAVRVASAELRTAALKIDAQQLDAPQAFRAAQEAMAKHKRQQAMQRARAFARADESDARAKKAREVVLTDGQSDGWLYCP